MIRFVIIITFIIIIIIIIAVFQKFELYLNFLFLLSVSAYANLLTHSWFVGRTNSETKSVKIST